MSETIYLGSGKTVTGQYVEFFNVTLNLDKIKQNPNVVEDYIGNKFVRLRIYKKDQPDKFGKNVNVVWNDPSNIKKKAETDSDSGLPF